MVRRNGIQKAKRRSILAKTRTIQAMFAGGTFLVLTLVAFVFRFAGIRLLAAPVAIIASIFALVSIACAALAYYHNWIGSL